MMPCTLFYISFKFRLYNKFVLRNRLSLLVDFLRQFFFQNRFVDRFQKHRKSINLIDFPNDLKIDLEHY